MARRSKPFTDGEVIEHIVDVHYQNKIEPADKQHQGRGFSKRKLELQT